MAFCLPHQPAYPFPHYSVEVLYVSCFNFIFRRCSINNFLYFPDNPSAFSYLDELSIVKFFNRKVFRQNNCVVIVSVRVECCFRIVLQRNKIVRYLFYQSLACLLISFPNSKAYKEISIAFYTTVNPRIACRIAIVALMLSFLLLFFKNVHISSNSIGPH